MHSLKPQRGIALIAALILLVVFTLFAVSGLSSSTASLRIAGNMQSRLEVQAAAQRALEQVANDVTSFQFDADTPPPARDIEVTLAEVTYPVALTLHCLGSAPAPGYSAAFAASAPAESYWELRASATDPRSGANAVVVQGFKVVLAPGQFCPT